MNIADEIIAFAIEEAGITALPVTRETTIENGLGVTGDDAVSFMKKYAKKFNVDISHFQWEVYFNPEPGMFAVYRPIKPLSLGDLMKAVETGHLF